MKRVSSASASMITDLKGSAAVEFALVGPLFVMLLISMIVYGGWFWLAQSVQHLASEGARAAVGGMTAAEQTTMARTAVAQGADGGGAFAASAAVVGVQTTPETIRVTVTYNAATHPIMALAGLVPAPPALIVRSAVVRVGGY